MTVTDFKKTVLYAAVSLLAIGFSAWATVPMYTSDQTVAVYIRSIILLCVAACGIIGAGVWSFFGYTRRHREHRADTLLWLIVGGVLLILSVIIVCRFGGMTEDNLNDRALAAINLNIMLFGALPMPFLVRTLWAAGKSARRAPAAVIAALPTVAYAVCILAGVLFRTLHTV